MKIICKHQTVRWNEDVVVCDLDNSVCEEPGNFGCEEPIEDDEPAEDKPSTT